MTACFSIGFSTPCRFSRRANAVWLAIAVAWTAAADGGEPAADLPAVPTLNHTLRAVPAPGAVKLDGDLSEWDDSGAIVIADNQRQPRKLVRAAAISPCVSRIHSRS